jgi:DNA-binding transcriptional LysR family regulator
MKALDIEAVQAFVLTADFKSFTRAAEALDTTQSAVSLKIKRLEDGLGRRLLERTPRQVRLSADGDAFLTAARHLIDAHHGAVASFGVKKRRLVVGISHHIVGAELPMLLKRMGAAEPDLTLELRIATSREVLADFEQGSIDAAIASTTAAATARRSCARPLPGWPRPASRIRVASRSGLRPRPRLAASAAWRSRR